MDYENADDRESNEIISSGPAVYVTIMVKEPEFKPCYNIKVCFQRPGVW